MRVPDFYATLVTMAIILLRNPFLMKKKLPFLPTFRNFKLYLSSTKIELGQQREQP